jgi:hypothetical protein
MAASAGGLLQRRSWMVIKTTSATMLDFILSNSKDTAFRDGGRQ